MKKLLSQNFLWNRELVRKLIRDSSISQDDSVLEIGPGKGIITEQLSLVCQRITAVEEDPKLYGSLQQKFNHDSHLLLLPGDIRKFVLPAEPFKVFSNIPFSITGEVVKKLLFSDNPPVDSYLVVQREAAMKFIANDHRNTMLATLFFPWFDIKIVHEFQRSDFKPMPSVDSCFIRLNKRELSLVSLASQSVYRDFVVYRFTRDRSATSLSPNEWLIRFNVFVRGNDLRVCDRIKGSFGKWRAEEKKLSKIHRTRTDKNWKMV